MKDGKFTRASVHKGDIVDVANLYYKNTPGKWIVLELDCKMLYGLGIAMLAQEAPESVLTKEPVKCLQIFGGIATSLPGLVHSIYPVFRKSSTGEFIKLLDPVRTAKEAENEASQAKKASKKESDKVRATLEEPLKPSPSKEKKKRGMLGMLKRGKSNSKLQT
ncbi:MAG: hypothetical protein SGARI_005346 [Bacillariaceae sp.]